MQRRAVFSLVNVAVAAVALVVLFAFPRYAGYAVYAFLGWFVVSIAVIGLARATPPVASSSAAPSMPGGRPLPAGGSQRPGGTASPPPIAFCVYCAGDLPPEARRCPACGHAVLGLT